MCFNLLGQQRISDIQEANWPCQTDSDRFRLINIMFFTQSSHDHGSASGTV